MMEWIRKLGTTEKRMLTGGALLAAGAVLVVLAGQTTKMAEGYSSYVYPVLVSTIGRVSGLFPLSLSEICLYALIFLLFGTFVQAVISAVRSKQGGAVMLRWASGLFVTVAAMMFLYVINCGVNYQRIPFSEKSGMQISKYSAEDLKQVCLWLTKEVNARSGKVERDENGIMKLSRGAEEAAVKVMEQLGREYPDLAGHYPKPKGLLVSEILSWQGISGIYSPFTVEANYNEDMTPYNIPFTVCHELSHLRGFMQEEEANFIAFLACKSAPREDFQYSGYLMGWVYSMNALYKADTNSWQEIRSGLSDSPVVDLKANSKFWNKYKGPVAEVSTKVNDTYLKANGQTEGVESYDRMVDLLVAYYKNMYEKSS